MIPGRLGGGREKSNLWTTPGTPFCLTQGDDRKCAFFCMTLVHTRAILLHKLPETFGTFLCIISAWHPNHSQTLTLMHPWQDLKYAASQSSTTLSDRRSIRFVSRKALTETKCLSTRITSQVEIFSISIKKLTKEMDLILDKAYQESQKGN